ncbi:MAG: 3-oxo-5a-steroid 4- dehydrogenase [Alectoria fallacina]|uniref:very-long-chain enoyl-CoA reductase n=1 Tax=Alectoria fallacina TaxID=1903189 RepID=A0A8H3J8L0_9LECA|nr:MAG: 3-oxo-5a-steroid 4- dehydrogenase [Alectoria fallacina]
MAAQKMTLAVRPRGKPVKKLPEEVSLPTNGPTSELYKQLALKAGTTIHRLRVTKGSDGSFVPNSKDLSIDSTGLREQSTIYVKDLGPQIAWRTVFLVEYLGPLLIHPLLYLILPSTPNGSGPSQLQTLTLALVCLHFAKRELETLFVHRFSSATMPAFNIFKNSAHYWLLSGLNMAYWIYLPSAPAARESDPLITYPGLALFVIGELGNLSNHLTLRSLRSSGGAERGIPQGPGFGLVTCPNYMFETMAWIGIALVSWSWSTVLFAVVAAAQMGLWAKKKEARYRKDFGGKYQKKRFSMLPGIW